MRPTAWSSRSRAAAVIHCDNQAMDGFGGLEQQLTPWFRFFVAPGMGHCSGGVGPQPQALFDRLVELHLRRQRRDAYHVLPGHQRAIPIQVVATDSTLSALWAFR